jgi:hypothetical protein
MYYLRFVDKYMYPVLIKGKSLVNDNLDKAVEETTRLIADFTGRKAK